MDNASGIRHHQGISGRIGLESRTSALRTELRLPQDLPLQAWARIGSQISLLTNSSAWWLGDWLVYGRDNYPNRYRQAMKETSLDYQTLRNYAWVAGRFDVSRRRDTLSFQHHAVVAALPAAEQDEWLDRASSSNWSMARLRAEVKTHGAKADSQDGAERSIIHLNLSGSRLDQWGAAAQQQQKDLVEWVVSIVDETAAQVLSCPQPYVREA
jgi:hypothetical protein